VATLYPDLIIKFGGHAMAAGLSIDLKNLERFESAFQQEIARVATPELFAKELLTDGALNAPEMTLATVSQLEQAGPWGQHFRVPVFQGVFRLLDQRLIQDKHLKCTLALEESDTRFSAIAFNVDRAEWPNPGCERVCVAYRLE